MPQLVSRVVPAVALGLAVLACHVSEPQPGNGLAAPPVATPTAAAPTPLPVATATPPVAPSPADGIAPPAQPTAHSPGAAVQAIREVAAGASGAVREAASGAVRDAASGAVREVAAGAARVVEPVAQPAPTVQAIRVTQPTAVAGTTRRAESEPAAPAVAAGRGGANVYLVRTGDTLSTIASRHQVTVEAIARANGLGDRDFIRVGQTLRLP